LGRLGCFQDEFCRIDYGQRKQMTWAQPHFPLGMQPYVMLWQLQIFWLNVIEHLQVSLPSLA
jgi:hypothetical protein